jgi:hypothetical protein
MMNGRCRMHGGASPGAPKGNNHAFKHGRFTAEAIAERREFAALLRDMKGLVEQVEAEAVDRVGLRPPMAPRNSDRGRFDHMIFNSVCHKGTMDPEPVKANFLNTHDFHVGIYMPPSDAGCRK